MEEVGCGKHKRQSDLLLPGPRSLAPGPWPRVPGLTNYHSTFYYANDYDSLERFLPGKQHHCSTEANSRM